MSEEGTYDFYKKHKLIQRLSTNTLDNVIDIDIPKERFLIDDVITEGGVHCFYGSGGSFKSSLMLYLSLSLAGGKSNIFGEVKEPTKVLWIDEEMGLNTLINKTKCLIKGNNYELTEEQLKNFHYMSYTNFKLDDDNADGVLKSYIAKGVKLIVVDSIAATVSGDLNSTNDIRKLRDIGKLAHRYGISIVYIAHVSKSNKDIPELESIFGAVDFGNQIDNAFYMKAFDNNYRICQTKIRNAPREDAIDFNFTVKGKKNEYTEVCNKIQTSEVGGTKKKELIGEMLNWAYHSGKKEFKSKEIYDEFRDYSKGYVNEAIKSVFSKKSRGVYTLK